MSAKNVASIVVLTRRPGQALMIRDNVEVRLLTPRFPGEVRVGITAPRSVSVVRQEARCRRRLGGSGDAARQGGKGDV